MRIKLNLFFILFLFLSYYIGYLHVAVIIFLSVFLHELGHVWAARMLKLRVEEIEIFPFGGVARMEQISKYGGATEALVALAGPLVSLLLAMMFYVISIFGETFFLITKYNFILFIFNLIPVLPMDGGRIARNILMYFNGYRKATKIMSLLGRVFAIALVIYNALMIINGDTSVAYLITAIFVFLGAEKEMKYCSYYYLFYRNNKKIKAIKKNTIKKRVIEVRGDVLIRVVANNFSPSSLCEIRVIDNKGRLIKKLSETDIMDSILNYGYDSKLRQIIK